MVIKNFDKVKYDLKNIIGIDVNGKSDLDILNEIKDVWCYLDPIAKELISESMAGKKDSCKFRIIMDF